MQGWHNKRNCFMQFVINIEPITKYSVINHHMGVVFIVKY